MSNNKHTSYKVAVGGVVSALCLTLMFMTGVFPLLSMAIPIYAGALMIIVAKEVSVSWAFSAYCAVSLLSMFLTPDKEAATLFIVFFGYYPIILPKLDKIKLAPLKIGVKALIFNSAIIIWYKTTMYLLGIYNYLADLAFLGKFAVPALLIFINLVFLLYDYTISMILEIYVNWFRPTYFGKRKPSHNKISNEQNN